MHHTSLPLPASHSALSALERLVTVAAESGFYRCNSQLYIRVTVAGAEYCQPRFQTQVHSTDTRQGQLDNIDVWIKQHNFDGPDHDASFIHIHSEIQKWRIVFIYSREDEIRDAGNKWCTGHGWASIRRVSLKICAIYAVAHICIQRETAKGAYTEREGYRGMEKRMKGDKIS